MATKFVFHPTDPTQLQEQYDLIIIGSGGTGLTSALQAYELGLHPVILEKNTQIGGNTTRASSGMNAAETNIQLQHQIVDSFAEFYQDTLQGGGQKNNPHLLHYFTEHSALAIDWLAQHGIELTDLTITGGMKIKRTHRPASMAPIGGFLVNQLLQQIAQAQIPLFTEVAVTQILQAQGKVSGVQVKQAGQEKTIAAAAVILATGGFGASSQLLEKYRPDLRNLKTTNQPGATGDGIKLAQAAGADLVDMDQVQVHPTVQQESDHAFLIGEAVRGEGAILVDQNGERFVNELATRKEVTAAIDCLPGRKASLIFDQEVRQRVQAIEFYDHIGLVLTATTWAGLAQQNQWEPATLTTTIQNWNQVVTQKALDPLGRTTGRHTLTTRPFYAIHIAPAVHYTMGGVVINELTQVLTPEQKVIPGLFAAGEVAGGLHGNNRIGGNSIAETVIFGRQAGQQAFKYCKTLIGG
ncbi:flavocytochrome c [Lactobacillus sp. DCY120]|uniref:Flavocytochrome c n=1 Tax=Bombilactobacillus apium TaxID=2675299 RepID=A0A850QWQ2_9LACO|nr:flavocytochrome c [Bombilactobacillus apium]NVY96234.1 flavocytochrome c [Bombilactobacillus apium]